MDIRKGIDLDLAGREMYDFIKTLYPTCRSITGNGLRETLSKIREHIPIVIQEVRTGTQVYDWVVPKEWNIRDAYVKNDEGEKVIDFERSNLHVLQYSVPVKRSVSLSELKEHLFTLPDQPEWVPYRTSYYNETWGFCLSHSDYMRLKDGQYEVCIDSTIDEGAVTFGELLLRGRTEDEVLISCHCCHPSLCNDNLSGIALSTWLSRHLAKHALNCSYRFLFIPGTIGAITWLFLNESSVSRIKHGLVVAGVGDSGEFTYKMTRNGNADIDRVVKHVLKHHAGTYRVVPFSPYGYDERQYCSPGFDLPVGSLTRSCHGSYPQYHTSADNLEFVGSSNLAESLSVYLEVVYMLENNRRYLNLVPKCEPQLGRRGLYRSLGGMERREGVEQALRWVLNFSDGEHTLVEIAEKSMLPFDAVFQAATVLSEHGLLKEIPTNLPRG